MNVAVLELLVHRETLDRKVPRVAQGIRASRATKV